VHQKDGGALSTGECHDIDSIDDRPERISYYYCFHVDAQPPYSLKGEFTSRLSLTSKDLFALASVAQGIEHAIRSVSDFTLILDEMWLGGSPGPAIASFAKKKAAELLRTVEQSRPSLPERVALLELDERAEELLRFFFRRAPDVPFYCVGTIILDELIATHAAGEPAPVAAYRGVKAIVDLASAKYGATSAFRAARVAWNVTLAPEHPVLPPLMTRWEAGGWPLAIALDMRDDSAIDIVDHCLFKARNGMGGVRHSDPVSVFLSMYFTYQELSIAAIYAAASIETCGCCHKTLEAGLCMDDNCRGFRNGGTPASLRQGFATFCVWLIEIGYWQRIITDVSFVNDPVLMDWTATEMFHSSEPPLNERYTDEVGMIRHFSIMRL